MSRNGPRKKYSDFLGSSAIRKIPEEKAMFHPKTRDRNMIAKKTMSRLVLSILWFKLNKTKIFKIERETRSNFHKRLGRLFFYMLNLAYQI